MGTTLANCLRTLSTDRGSGFPNGSPKLDKMHEMIPAVVPLCMAGSIPFKSLNVFCRRCLLASSNRNLWFRSRRRKAKAMPSSKGMLNRAGIPTRLKSCTETGQERMRLKIRASRPSPYSGTSSTHLGVRPIATSVQIRAINWGSYELSNGTFRNTLRRLRSFAGLMRR